MSVTRQIPVFPLPDVVFFPGTVLPLHVFETRYRAMVRDALAADRTIAVALLQPGWEQRNAGNPEYFPVATAGRMEELETTSDGRYYFKLAGLVRVRLGEETVVWYLGGDIGETYHETLAHATRYPTMAHAQGAAWRAEARNPAVRCWAEHV